MAARHRFSVHIYQLGEDQYQAVLIRGNHRGKLVEVWPLHNERDCRFLVSHGSAFSGMSDKVVRLAQLVQSHIKGEIELTFPQDTVVPGFWARLRARFRRRQ